MAIRVTSSFETSPAARLTKARATAASANEHVEPTDAAAGAFPVDQYSRSITEGTRARGRARSSPDFWGDVVSFGGPLVSEEIGALLVHLQEARGQGGHLLIAPAEVDRLMEMYQTSNDVGAPPPDPYAVSTDAQDGAEVLTITPREIP
jgi:hypothetical protein